MYCVNCGKEIENNYNVCPYCGTAVGNTVKQTDNTQNAGMEQDTVNQHDYNNQQYYNSSQTQSNVKLKPDDKYNIIAGLFTLPWALFKGMWDLFLVCLVFMFLGLIPVIGQVLTVIWLIIRLIIWGRTANYYYRLKKTQNIWLYKAIADPDLRRL